MSNIQPYIILNDIDSRTISGLLISSLPPISKPQVRTQVETVDGRDGDLVTSLGFSAYDKEITIGLTYGYDIDDVIEYFNSEGVVVFSNEPDKFYRYAIYEQIDFDKLIRFKKAEVTLHCQPFKFSTTEESELFDVVSGQAITVKNDGNIYSRPDITVIGSGEVDVSLNGSQILSLELADNQAVIIDSEDMNAYAAQSAIREVIAEVNAYQEGSGDPSPDNERNIIGFNGACINLYSVNVWDEQAESGLYNVSTGEKQSNANYMRSINLFKVQPETTYYLKTTKAENHIGCFDNNKNFLTTRTKSSSGTFTTPTGCYWISLTFSGNQYDNSISINYPSTDTEYHKYIGSKYQSYFEGLLNGTYGFVDLGTLTWVKDTTSLSVTVFRAFISDRKAGTSTFICSKYPTLTNGRNGLINTDKAIASWNIIDSQLVGIRDDSLSSGTADDFTTAMDGVYLIYELATPTTPTITQNDIDMLISKFNADLVCVVFDQTVYGGSLNVTTGELTIDKGFDIINGSVNWNMDTTPRVRYFDASVLSNNSINWNTNVLSNMFTQQGHYPYAQIGGSVRTLRLAFDINDTSITSVEQLNALLNQTPLQVVYPLADPIVIQLTPSQVNNLLGLNNLYSDTGDITVKHKSNGVIVTNTGAIVSFTVAVDDMEKGALLNRLVTGDYDKIRLKKGDNTIVLTGNAQQFVIDKYSRWI